MSRQYVAFGSWKLRYNEPMDSAENEVQLAPLLREVPPSTFVTVLDMDEDVHDASLPARRHGHIPLAIVSETTGGYTVTHPMLRVDDNLAQFMACPSGYHDVPERSLSERIVELFERYHLIFANHERYYTKSRETTELEQKFSIRGPVSYLQVARRIFAALDDGRFEGFQNKLSYGFQFWRYDNFFYEILPNPQHDEGYVSMMHWTRRKFRWDEPIFTYKKKLFNQDSLERWEKNYLNQRVEGDKQQLLEEFFGYQTRHLGDWRRMRADVVAEAHDTGNMFMVNVDDCRPLDPGSKVNRLQQVEIEYIKTLGQPAPDVILADFNKLVDHVEKCLAEQGLEPRRTFYSKMSWLRDSASTGGGP